MAANFGTGLIAFQYPELDQQIRRHTGIDRLTLAFGQTTQEPIAIVGTIREPLPHMVDRLVSEYLSKYVASSGES